MGSDDSRRIMFGEMARMLMDKGIRHEQAVLDRYRADGRTVLEVPERARGRVVRGGGPRGSRPCSTTSMT